MGAARVACPPLALAQARALQLQLVLELERELEMELELALVVYWCLGGGAPPLRTGALPVGPALVFAAT